MALLQLLLAFPALLAVHVFLRKLAFRRRMRGCKLPPSRAGYPVIGNVLDIPTANESAIYGKWAKELNSDIFYVNAAGTPIVVLNTPQLAVEMLEGRSLIYSGRPGLTMINELMDYGWLFSMLPYGKEWKERRKLFQKYLSPAASNEKSFIPAYNQEHIGNFLIRLVDSPEDFMHHARHVIGALSISIVYGLPVQPLNDPYIGAAEAFILRATEASVPGAFYVDFLPILRHIPAWVPGAGFQRKAREWREVMKVARDRTFEDSEKQIASGSAQISFVSKAIENINPSQDAAQQRRVIIETAGAIFGATADTTTATIGTFFLAMMCYPEAQKRAQQQLDEVLGGRLPEFQDEADGKLPYIAAIVREILRWKPVAPIGFPHQSQKDDIFHGYFIPEGTIVIANGGAMLHNEEDYPNPNEFIPERFLDDKGQINLNIRDPSTVAFGFGRRICPGAHIARSTMWLIFASVLSLYDISKPIDSNGNPIEPSIEYASGIIAHPKPFKCIIKPRSKHTEEAIESLRESKVQV